MITGYFDLIGQGNIIIPRNSSLEEKPNKNLFLHLREELRFEIMTMRIYLDTNQWIKLGQIANGKENDPEYKKIFTAIRELTKNDEIRVLFSAFTLNEIWKYHNVEKQNELIDLILDISKSWVLKPYNLFVEKEIENAASFVLEKKYIHDIHSEILGRGVGDIFGISFEWMLQNNPLMERLIKNNTLGLSYDFFKEDFQKMNEDVESIKKHLKSSGMREMTQKIFEENKKILENMEENRFKNSEMKKDLFSRYSQARALKDSVVQHLAVFLQSKKITVEQLFPPNGEEKMKIFNKHLNSMNVLSILVLERDFSSDNPIISNDAYDMAHLSGAIPYCDVVVTEKMFAHISRKKELDVIYGCQILDDLRLLAQIEPIKSKIQSLGNN